MASEKSFAETATWCFYMYLEIVWGSRGGLVALVDEFDEQLEVLLAPLVTGWGRLESVGSEDRIWSRCYLGASRGGG